jgi:pimeloyl-ACP methyl ester carboxylesterase
MTSSLVRRSVVTVDGIRSPLLETGHDAEADAAEEAVVLLHGNPGSGEDWADLLERLAGERIRAVAPDMPGFGHADKPADFPYTVAGYAAHLDRLLSSLGIRRVHLVLHDFGGPWGLTWAAQHPDAFASVTLLNSGVLLGYRWHYLARIWRTRGLGEAFLATSSRPAFGLLLKHGNPTGLPPAFVDRMYDSMDAGTKRAILRLYRATGDVAGMALQIHRVLAPLRRPALVVWGAADPYIKVHHAYRQRETFPQAEVVELPRSGHWPMADDPEGVAAVVLPFLLQQSAAGGREAAQPTRISVPPTATRSPRPS